MKRKDYEKPTMQVVKYESTAELLVASGEVNATMDNVWDEEDIDE